MSLELPAATPRRSCRTRASSCPSRSAGEHRQPALRDLDADVLEVVHARPARGSARGCRQRAAQATVCPSSWPCSSLAQERGSAHISHLEERQNHAWPSYTTPFLTGDVSTYPASPSRHPCAFHRPLRRFPSNVY